PLWRAIASLGALRAIVAAPAERWFVEAAVNAMIVVVERGGAPGDVSIARLRVPTADAAARLASGAAISHVAELRDAGRDPSAWAAALRAPGGWFALAAAANGALVP